MKSFWTVGSAAALAFVLSACSPTPSPHSDEQASLDTATATTSSPYGEPDDAPIVETTTETATATESAPAPAPAPARRHAARPATQHAAAPAPGPVSLIADDQPVSGDTIEVIGTRTPHWAQWPTRRQLAVAYPQHALERGLPGEATLDCTVKDDRTLDCSTVSETPVRYGFGRGAQSVARRLRVADDETATNLRLHVVFQLDEHPHR